MTVDFDKGTWQKIGVHCLSLSGFQFKIRYKILHKLRKAGALSKAEAVTINEADLDIQEQMWIDYFAGAFLGKIKKTGDNRYYVILNPQKGIS